ncbi:hypothetical protein D3P08_22055 [Paenibacillus nanensis]|uniref:Uncharacterized protein n=1 Tax=Paenibacillus nanensis TaxID=393251 RepID=A0A3A1UQA1_9BACL|nr:hypothetical protein [Paenibacillus nanensis]RIX49956.1 hypothetical protein D3P08_22055 [Paenibacillus nanensis]
MRGIRHAVKLTLTMAGLAVMMGCTGAAPNRSPEEWLSLSYSGLAAMDQYSFAGSMQIGMGEGVMLRPKMFEGNVVNHHQLTIQSEHQDPLYWNPVEVLKALNQSYETVEMLPLNEGEASNKEIIAIRVKEKEAASKKRWSSALRREMEQLTGGIEQGNHPSMTKRMELLAQANKELDDMLSTLNVVTEYDITIDRQRMLPLKMEERTLFDYTRKNRPIRENRQTTVRFEAFDGASVPVQ